MYKQVLDNKMPKQSIKYEYIHHVFNVIFIIILLSVFIFLWKKFEWWTFLIYLVPALAIILILALFIHPIIKLKRTSFEIGEHYIEVQKGLYYQKRIVQPYSRVQFVTVKHGPISRMLNIYFIIVVTAGSSVFLPAVNRDIAEKTRLNIMTKVKEVTDDV